MLAPVTTLPGSVVSFKTKPSLAVKFCSWLFDIIEKRKETQVE